MSDDDLELRRERGRLASATRAGDDLAVAYYQFKVAKVTSDQARANLEAMIVAYVEQGQVPISSISKRSHTARSVIYRIMHRNGLMPDHNTQEDDNHGDPHEDHGPGDQESTGSSVATG